MTKKTISLLQTAESHVSVAFAALVIGLAFTFCATCAVSAYSERTQGGIEQKIIRFHILANSDSDEDQALKLALRDAIFARYSGELNLMGNVNETREFLLARLEELRLFAEDFLRSAGCEYPVAAALDSAFFPTRDYGGLRFPAGEYEALRIVIGAGEGRNFWCVMFPPLCFVDAAHDKAAPESVSKIKNILSEEEYSVVSSKAPQYKVKFKIVEIWQNLTRKRSS